MNTVRLGYIPPPQSGSVVCHKSVADCWPNLLHNDDHERRVCRHTHAIYRVTRRGWKGLIFQQDGAWPHTSKESMAMLCGFFGDRLVSTGLAPIQICPLWTISCGDTWKLKFLKLPPYQMRTYSVKELRKKFNESRLIPSVWDSEIFDDGHSCAKMFWEPSSNTFCKIKSFSFLQISTQFSKKLYG